MTARAQEWEPPQFDPHWHRQHVHWVQTGAQYTSRPAPDIRHPGPDSADFPNSPNTLAKGRMYIENSPVGFLFRDRSRPNQYQWEFLIRYGLTNRIEFRVFSNGL